jgi:hypothetical protein
VQVGAFNRANLAQEQLGIAAKAAPSLAGQDSTVTPVMSGKREFHRARFTGLSEAEARSACRQLAKSGMDCAVLPPSAAKL